MTSDNPDEMLSAWTPGPWSTGPAHVVRQQTVDDQGRRVTRFVAEAVLSAPFVDGEREANARLIAAAPDLAEALTDILDYSGGADSALEDEYVMERARAALSRLNP